MALRKTHFDELAAKIKNKDSKESVRDYIFSLPKEPQLALLKQALDENTDAGKFFRAQRILTETSLVKGTLFELAQAYLRLAGKQDADFTYQLATEFQADILESKPSDEALIYYMKLRGHCFALFPKDKNLELRIHFWHSEHLDSPDVINQHLILIVRALQFGMNKASNVLSDLELSPGSTNHFGDAVAHLARQGNTQVVNTFIWMLINCITDTKSIQRIFNILTKETYPYGWFNSDKTPLLTLIRTKLKPLPQTIYMLWRYGFLVEEGHKLSQDEQRAVLDYIYKLPRMERHDALQFAAASDMFAQYKVEIRGKLGLSSLKIKPIEMIPKATIETKLPDFSMPISAAASVAPSLPVFNMTMPSVAELMQSGMPSVTLIQPGMQYMAYQEFPSFNPAQAPTLSFITVSETPAAIEPPAGSAPLLSVVPASSTAQIYSGIQAVPMPQMIHPTFPEATAVPNSVTATSLYEELVNFHLPPAPPKPAQLEPIYVSTTTESEKKEKVRAAAM